MSFEYKMCIVLRTDLDMTTGKLIAQACHAAVAASDLCKKENHKTWMRWRDEGGKKVALGAESLEELEELAARADEFDIIKVTIQDAGHTQIPPGTVTTLGLGPDTEERLDKVTGHLLLIK